MQVADSAADIRVNRTKTYLYHHHAYDYSYALRMHARIGGQMCSRLLLLMFLARQKVTMLVYAALPGFAECCVCGVLW